MAKEMAELEARKRQHAEELEYGKKDWRLRKTAFGKRERAVTARAREARFEKQNHRPLEEAPVPPTPLMNQPARFWKGKRMLLRTSDVETSSRETEREEDQTLGAEGCDE